MGRAWEGGIWNICLSVMTQTPALEALREEPYWQGHLGSRGIMQVKDSFIHRVSSRLARAT